MTKGLCNITADSYFYLTFSAEGEDNTVVM